MKWRILALTVSGSEENKVGQDRPIGKMEEIDLMKEYMVPSDFHNCTDYSWALNVRIYTINMALHITRIVIVWLL